MPIFIILSQNSRFLKNRSQALVADEDDNVNTGLKGFKQSLYVFCYISESYLDLMSSHVSPSTSRLSTVCYSC